MLWVLKRINEHPKHMLKLMSKKMLTILCSNFFVYLTLCYILTDPSVGMAAQMEVVSAGAVAGIVLGVFLVLVIVILFVGYR